MRTSIRRPAVLAATAMAALSLTLTACGGGADAAKDKSAPAPAAASDTAGGEEKAPAAGEESAQESAGSDTSGSGTSGSATQTSSKKRAGAKATGAAPACAAGDVNISAAKQDGVPTTHITLTAKNVSGHSCTLLQYPLIAFGDIQTAKDVPPVAKSKPATAVVLTPGAPAYAAVRINGGGVDEDTRAVTSFNVNLFATGGPAEGSKVVTAPKGGISVTDAIAKTGYWTYELRNGADDF